MLWLRVSQLRFCWWWHHDVKVFNVAPKKCIVGDVFLMKSKCFDRFHCWFTKFKCYLLCHWITMKGMLEEHCSGVACWQITANFLRWHSFWKGIIQGGALLKNCFVLDWPSTQCCQRKQRVDSLLQPLSSPGANRYLKNWAIQPTPKISPHSYNQKCPAWSSKRMINDEAEFREA